MDRRWILAANIVAHSVAYALTVEVPVSSQFDGRYAKEFLAGWGSMDLNGHMGNTAYLNLAADMMRFSPSTDSRRANFASSPGSGDKEGEIEYFREIGLHETVTVTCALLAMSPDGARFTIENEIWSASGERAAVVRSTGGWLDLRARKLVAPPPELLAAFSQVPRAPGFVELPARAKNQK